jgi:hypothetical protein
MFRLKNDRPTMGGIMLPTQSRSNYKLNSADGSKCRASLRMKVCGLMVSVDANAMLKKSAAY